MKRGKRMSLTTNQANAQEDPGQHHVHSRSQMNGRQVHEWIF